MLHTSAAALLPLIKKEAAQVRISLTLSKQRTKIPAGRTKAFKLTSVRVI